MNWKNVAGALAIVLLTVLLWIGTETALLVRETRKAVAEVRQDVFELSYLANENLLYLRGTLTEIQEASAQWNKASQEQRRYWKETGGRANVILAEAEATVADARLLIQRADWNINEALLPEATADLKRLGEGLISLRDTADALQRLAADPTNAAIQEEALAALRQTELTAAQAERMLAAGQRVLEQTEKVPPVVRKTLWTQIGSTILIMLKTMFW